MHLGIAVIVVKWRYDNDISIAFVGVPNCACPLHQIQKGNII